MARMEVPPHGVRQAAQQRGVALLQARDALHQLELRLARKQVHISCTGAAGISLGIRDPWVHIVVPLWYTQWQINMQIKN